MGLILDCARSGERGLLDLEGTLDDDGAAQLKRRAVDLIATGCNELVVNVERVPAIHAPGLEALTRIEAMLPGTKRALSIAGPSPAVRAQLESAGLAELAEESLPPDDLSFEWTGAHLLSHSA